MTLPFSKQKIMLGYTVFIFVPGTGMLGACGGKTDTSESHFGTVSAADGTGEPEDPERGRPLR